MSPKDHWLSGPYITMMAAKRQGTRWRWVNMRILSTCDLSYCMVMFLNDFYDDKPDFGVNIGFEDLIGRHCHWTYVLINKRAVVRIENSSGNLLCTAKSPDCCTTWGEEFIEYSKERKSCRLNSCTSYPAEWVDNLTGQERTHGAVMYCYPVVPGGFTTWLPRLDSHRTEQPSHFSETQKIICSWPTAAVLFYWKVSIASCLLEWICGPAAGSSWGRSGSSQAAET